MLVAARIVDGVLVLIFSDHGASDGVRGIVECALTKVCLWKKSVTD